MDGAFGGDVTYQLEPRRERFVGRDVVVIGSGDSGALDALELVGKASSVTLVHRSDALKARQDIVEQVRPEPRIEDLPGWELESTAAIGSRRSSSSGRPMGSAAAERRRRDREDRARPVLRSCSKARSSSIMRERSSSTRSAHIVRWSACCRRRHRRRVSAVAVALGQGVLAARSVLRFVQGRRDVVDRRRSLAVGLRRHRRIPQHTRGAGRAGQASAVMELLRDLHDNNLDAVAPRGRCAPEDADPRVAAAKRDIDVLNLNGIIWSRRSTPLAPAIAQTRRHARRPRVPRSVFDRLSILVIRISFTESAASLPRDDRDPYVARCRCCAGSSTAARGARGAPRGATRWPQALRAASEPQAVRTRYSRYPPRLKP